jgi:hypothetical protein
MTGMLGPSSWMLAVRDDRKRAVRLSVAGPGSSSVVSTAAVHVVPLRVAGHEQVAPPCTACR